MRADQRFCKRVLFVCFCDTQNTLGINQKIIALLWIQLKQIAAVPDTDATSVMGFVD